MKYTTVAELIELLTKVDSDSIVLLSIDEEGNGFNPFSNNYSTGIWNEKWREFHDDEEANEDQRLDGRKAIVLWP